VAIEHKEKEEKKEVGGKRWGWRRMHTRSVISKEKGTSIVPSKSSSPPLWL